MPRQPLTAATARVVFYDVEALPNVFAVSAYDPAEALLHVFHLVDGPLGDAFDPYSSTARYHAVADAVRDANPALPADVGIRFYDLRRYDSNHQLALMLGMFAGDRVVSADPVLDPPLARDTPAPLPVPLDEVFRPVCDTDWAYDPARHPLLMGYNSIFYDTVVLSLYLMEAFQTTRADVEAGSAAPRFEPTTAAVMAAHSARMFSDEFRKSMPSVLEKGSVAFAVRRAMLDCGRHVDAMRFNEGATIQLKRVLAQMGRQVLEFGDFTKEVPDEGSLVQLLAYNCSDVVGLSEVFRDPVYAGAFDLKAGLLEQYPECRYVSGKAPSPRNVRGWRLGIDATSAQFAARVLAPGKPLADLPAVSFLYPDQSVVDAHDAVPGNAPLERRDVLRDTLDWFRSQMDSLPFMPTGEPVVLWPGSNDEYQFLPARAAEAVEQVERALSYYASLEGLNVNDSPLYEGGVPFTQLSSVPKAPNSVPYFRHDGSMTSGYAVFSVGGVHGAQFDLDAWAADVEAVRARNAAMEKVRAAYPDPVEAWDATAGGRLLDVGGTAWTRSSLFASSVRRRDLVACRDLEASLLDDGVTPERRSHAESVLAEAYRGVGYRRPEPEPELFVGLPDGSNRLTPRYALTSAGPVIHMDFTSYYPGLLQNMAAFYNEELGENRYDRILQQKTELSARLKDPATPASEKPYLSVVVGGTKLVLNAATGAADTYRDSSIRMNNRILSMRVIGQLLTWRVAQAMSFAGATVVSTNTDGLYVMGLDWDTARSVLAHEAAAINVGIEPEPLLLVSKDSNNRVEFAVPPPGVPLSEAPILSAGGGSLAAFRGPTPKKSLAHAAVLDWALARYLRLVVAGAVALDEPFDAAVGEALVKEAAALEPFEACRLFQHVLVSSPAKRIVPFGVDAASGELVRLSHISRAFFVEPGTPGAMTFLAAFSTNAVGDFDMAEYRMASAVLADSGWTTDGRDGTRPLPTGHRPTTRKVTGVGRDWPAIVANHDLLCPPHGALTPAEIVSVLDLDRYVGMLRESFESNWMTRPSGGVDDHPAPDDEEADEDS